MLTNQERTLYFGMLYGSRVGLLTLALLLTYGEELVHCSTKRLKQCKRDKDKMVSESMAQSLHNSNYTEFWNTVKKHTRLKSIVPSSIDDVNGEANIANVFAEKYSELYRSAPYDVAHMMRINTKIDGLISTKCKTGGLCK